MPSKKDIAQFYDSMQNTFEDIPEPRHINNVASAGEIEGKILEIGCAKGIHGRLALEKNEDIIMFGMDISFALLKEARNVKNLFVFQGDAESLPIESEVFHTVFVMEVLEHLLAPEKALREINRILKMNGRLVLSVPNKWWIVPYLPALSKYYTPFKQITDGKYSPFVIRNLVRKCGFKIIKSRHSGPILGEKYDKYVFRIPGSVYLTKRVWLLAEKKKKGCPAAQELLL